MLRQVCSLSMLHTTYEKVHGGVRLGGLSMPNILQMLFYFKPMDSKKYSMATSRECLSSYDFTALYTSVLVEPALGIIKDLLEKDNTLMERTVLPLKDIILLLEFCFKNTYFPFKGNSMNRLGKQLWGPW